MNQPLPPPIGANRVGESDDPGDDPPVSSPSARTRLVAAGVVVALAIAAGLIGYRVIAGDDDGGGAGGDGVGSWNAIAVHEPESGDVIVVDDEGEELDTFEVEAEVGNMISSGPYVLIPSGEAEVIDTRSGERTALDIGDGEGARFLSAGSTIIAISSPNGANVRLVDAQDGSEIDVAEVGELTDPRILFESARFDEESGVASFIDESTSQSLLIDVVGDDEPAFLPGRVIDVAFGSALAIQPAGPESELRFHDLSGEERGAVDLPALRLAWLTGDSTALVVTAGGDLMRVSAERDEPEQLGSLSVEEGSSARLIELSGPERLVYETTEASVAVVDWEGTEIGEASGSIAEIMLANRPAQRCVAVRDDDEEDSMSSTQLLDAASGDTVGEPFDSRRNAPLFGSDDGCTVSTIGGDDAVVVHRDHLTEVESGPVLLSPDGETMIVRDERQNRLQLTSEDDDDPVELPQGPAVFIERS